VIEYKGVKWYYYQGALLPRVPPHYEIFLTQKEEKELLKRSKALFLRYTNEWDRANGEFWYVIKDKFNGINALSSNTRSKVRRGGKRNDVKRIDTEYILNHGYEVYTSAFDNYSTFIQPLSKKNFEKHVKSTNHEYWGVFDKESHKLVAYSENFIEGDICQYSTIKFHPKYQKNYTSYILMYEMNKFYLEEKKLKYVNDGARSISHKTTIQEYLIDKFKFRKAFVKLNIAYRWDVGFLVSILYPFKYFIQKLSHPIANKISVILHQEKIRRSFE